jgi:NAD(P)-dependent dehydrogenase (short-subunit alcohol dehydrogenase family)
MRATEQQTIMITGATDGLGRALAHELAAQGATLVLHGRSDEKGARLLTELRAATGNDKLTFLRADFARLADIHALAERAAGLERLDVLVNNAGMASLDRQVSEDGHELTFQVDYLACYVLAVRLAPLLARSAPARIVNVSSAGQATSRTGRYKIFPVVGTALMVVTMLLFHYQVQWDTPLPKTMAFMALMGIGLGLTMQTLVMSVQNAVPPQDMGTATASATFFRQLGGTAGTAIFLSVLFSTVGGKITTALGKAKSHPDFQKAVAAHPHAISPQSAKSVVTDSSFLKHLDPALAAPFKQGFADSMHLVFLIVAGVAVLAFLLMLTIKEVPLRRMSGAQARAQAEAEAAAAEEA